jgi:hypothetical protein
MALVRDALRYPAKRVLLQRTRLAYVHLGHLLTDAKRDRSARVYGYVAVWLPEELITLYLEEGEVVNATTTHDGVAFTPIAISDAVGRVPSSAEYGSICFHEASDEQLDTMYATQTGNPLSWPRELILDDGDAMLAFLYATMHDGAVEIQADGSVHYIMISSGSPVRGYFADGRPGDLVGHVKTLLGDTGHAARPEVRLWPRPDALPAQASPALIQAYRDLVAALVTRLADGGVDDASSVVERARHDQIPQYPLLERFSLRMPTVRDPVTDTATLTMAIAAWIGDALQGEAGATADPGQALRDLTASRRHMFQAAGLYDALPWKLQW